MVEILLESTSGLCSISRRDSSFVFSLLNNKIDFIFLIWVEFDEANLKIPLNLLLHPLNSILKLLPRRVLMSKEQKPSNKPEISLDTCTM